MNYKHIFERVEKQTSEIRNEYYVANVMVFGNSVVLQDDAWRWRFNLDDERSVAVALARIAMADFLLSDELYDMIFKALNELKNEHLREIIFVFSGDEAVWKNNGDFEKYYSMIDEKRYLSKDLTIDDMYDIYDDATEVIEWAL